MKKKKEISDYSKNIFNDFLNIKNELDIESKKSKTRTNIYSPVIRVTSKNNRVLEKNELKREKLINLYNSLLLLRENLIKKENELIQREKNLIEFENVLKSNEAILKNNIEEFEIYINTKINEIKEQFKQIEQIQVNKENSLREKELELIELENKLKLKQNHKINKSEIVPKKIYKNQIYCKNFKKSIKLNNEKKFLNSYNSESKFNTRNDNPFKLYSYSESNYYL